MDNKSPEFAETKEDIGVVLDEAYFPISLNCKNVNTIMRLTYKKWDSDKYFGYIKEFGLPEKKAFKDFSRGMKMKLDPIVRDEILDIFNDFTRDESHSVLISSHIVSDLEKICDYIAFLHRGRLVFAEEKDMLYENYALVNMTRAQLAAMPKGSVLGSRENSYGAEVLMLRSDIPAGMVPERITIEDIMLYMAREER